ncbi:hypothetical protein ACP70R_030789 [Stipagrostis hirtigluma subsp. patula]
MTGGGGACAVCKHQRRKCEPNCELAAYFPANRMNDFRALHLVFGVANLTKLIKANATEAARRRAADTLTWEARWRERDPSEGCYREVACLRRDNAVLRAENAALRRQADQCAACANAGRYAASTLQQQQQQQLLLVSAYGGARPGSAGNGGGVVPGNFVGGCYSDNGGVRGNGAVAVRPHAATAPAAQTMFGYAHDDRYRGAANGRNGGVTVARSDAAMRGQQVDTTRDNKHNAR